MSSVTKHVGLSFLFFGLVCFALGFAVNSAEAEVLASALTNLAAVGGIASGLSFASLSIFTLNGTYREEVLKYKGNIVRGILFYMLFVVMLVSVFSGISVIWADSSWIRIVFPFLVFLVVWPFYITFRITYTAYEWESRPTRPAPMDPKYIKK